SSFQFRFVNIAAVYWADAVWNIDYVRLDKNRNMYDTVVSDIGFAGDPSFLLNDYTSMPYRQFLPNKATETAPFYSNTIHNNRSVSAPLTYGFTASVLSPAALLQPVVYTNATVSANSIQVLANNAYTTTIPSTAVGRNDKVVFENKYFIQPTGLTGSSENDTIVKNIVFDNYLAYDDGSAEKSYYLNLYPTLPGKIAIEYYLNQPDTLRGLSIYFGRQLPFASYKSFSILVYSQLAGVNGAVEDKILLQQDLNNPLYVDTVNHFTNYKFENPLVLPPGTFFIGTLQPPGSGDDSIYFGLDVNRIGGNHAYYNVLNAWNPSLISGAIMMRPLLGQAVVASGVHDVADTRKQWSVSPNPAKDALRFDYDLDTKPTYRITDIQGRTTKEGTVPNSKTIDISGLVPGMYFVTLVAEGVAPVPQKIIKL
ncbi:MAG: C-terminal target protein, partial [Flavipsychrobacter sp.]|nr:C-terminal target protein [Flavipsychrobacter sp.]